MVVSIFPSNVRSRLSLEHSMLKQIFDFFAGNYRTSLPICSVSVIQIFSSVWLTSTEFPWEFRRNRLLWCNERFQDFPNLPSAVESFPEPVQLPEIRLISSRRRPWFVNDLFPRKKKGKEKRRISTNVEESREREEPAKRFWPAAETLTDAVKALREGRQALACAFVCVVTAAALRGVAIQRGRVGAARAAFPTSAAALALARNPGPLAAAAAATALHPFAPA